MLHLPKYNMWHLLNFDMAHECRNVYTSNVIIGGWWHLKLFLRCYSCAVIIIFGVKTIFLQLDGDLILILFLWPRNFAAHYLFLNFSITVTLETEDSGCCREVASVERFKQVLMYGLSANKGGCSWRFDCIQFSNVLYCKTENPLEPKPFLNIGV